MRRSSTTPIRLPRRNKIEDLRFNIEDFKIYILWEERLNIAKQQN